MDSIPSLSSLLIEELDEEFQELTAEDQFELLKEDPIDLAYQLGQRSIVDYLLAKLDLQEGQDIDPTTPILH